MIAHFKSDGLEALVLDKNYVIKRFWINLLVARNALDRKALFPVDSFAVDSLSGIRWCRYGIASGKHSQRKQGNQHSLP